jgi:hypothetical protein
MADAQTRFEWLDDYLRDVFRNYRRLMRRVSRWTDFAAPLNPATYPKGNTLQVPRWEIPSRLYPYLRMDKEVCDEAKLRLLAVIPFMKGAPPLPSQRQYDEVREKYPGMAEPVHCPLTGEPLSVTDLQNSAGQTSRIGNQELNIGFAELPPRGEMLSLESLRWVKPPYHVYALRAAFSQYSRLLTKVQTKAYLTDRKQTGDYPTNREARWEAHPRSPQFAYPRDCVDIEAKLLGQILTFGGADQVDLDDETREQIEHLLGSPMEPGIFRCPVSGESIDYKEFMEVAETSEHGRSKYQAAHLIPIAMPHGYHTAENVSWITELGNRVQGEDALEDIVQSIFRMARYHKERLGLSWDDIEQDG